MNQSVTILLFGITRDITGQSTLSLSLPPGATVLALLQQLQQQYPALTGIRSLFVAVNGEYAEDDQVVESKDEIALIPPVSGG